MGRKNNVQCRKHLLTYSQLDIGDSLLEEAQKTLQEGDIPYTNFHLSHPGESEQCQFERLLYNSQWLIIFFTVNYFNCPDSQFQLKMAFERACKQKLKNTIVLLPDYLLGLLLVELKSMPRIVINKTGWNRRFLDSLKATPMLQQETETCDNLNHVHLSDYTSLTDTPLSEPGTTREGLEDEGYFLPKFILKNVVCRIRWLKTLVRQEQPEEEEITKDIRRAVKSNWFWRFYNSRITPHEEPCVCYIKFVCFTEILILTRLFGICFYNMTDTTMIPLLEAKLVLCTFVVLLLLNLALFWSCSAVFRKIKRFALTFGLYPFEMIAVLMFLKCYSDAAKLGPLTEGQIRHNAYLSLLPFLKNSNEGWILRHMNLIHLSSKHRILRGMLNLFLLKSFSSVCSFAAFLYLPRLTSKYNLFNLLRMLGLLFAMSTALTRVMFLIELGFEVRNGYLIWSVCVWVNEISLVYSILQLVHACFYNETHHQCLSRCLNEWSRLSYACCLLLIVSGAFTAFVFYEAFLYTESVQVLLSYLNCVYYFSVATLTLQF